MKYLISLLAIAVILSSCVNFNPHASYEFSMNRIVEGQHKITEYPYNLVMKYLTHTTKDQNGNDVYHFLKADWKKGPYKGKCKIYYVVDPATDVIIDWGYDAGGNPESCVLTG